MAGVEVTGNMRRPDDQDLHGNTPASNRFENAARYPGEAEGGVSLGGTNHLRKAPPREAGEYTGRFHAMELFPAAR
jgi:hypothetical protein